MPTATDDLDAKVEFDSPFTVDERRDVARAEGVRAPEVFYVEGAPSDGVIEVVLAHAPIIKSFEEWLESRGHHLFRIPLPDDPDAVPAYGVAPRSL